VTQRGATPVATLERPASTPSKAAGARRWRTPSARARWRWGSDGLVAGIIALFGLVFWVPAAVHADFMLDDFAMLEHFELPGVGIATFRPVARLEWYVGYHLFGHHPTGYYVVLAIMMALIGAVFYAALRHLGLAAMPAAIAGVGIVAYPRADSIGAWWADPAAPALLLGLLSVLAGAVWVSRRGASLGWFVPTLVLVALSVLCYEAMAPLFLLALCLSPLSRNLRRTFVCAGASGLVALGSALYLFATEQNQHDAVGTGRYAWHLHHLMTGGWQALVLHGLSTPTVVGVGFGVVTMLTIVAVLAWRGGLVDAVAWRRLLLAVPLLVLGTALALVPFVPSGTYYEPTTPGTGNRVNALAQVFALACIAITIWLLCRLLGRAFGGRYAPAVTAAVAVLVAVPLLGGYAGSTKQDQNAYNVASARRVALIDEIHRLKPAVPRGDLVLLADYASQTGPPGKVWFPTIEDLWDASEIVSMTYHRPRMVADPVFSDTRCLASSVSIRTPTGTARFPYGRVVVIDLGRTRVERLPGRAACEAGLPSLVASS
jgi:hypothetical protein